MNSVFSVSKIDDINLRKYKINLKDYKKDTKKILEILFSFPEFKKSEIFNYNLSKIRFDISFCSDKTIQNINKTYRNKNTPTDVITFSFFVDDDSKIINKKTAELGQIIISPEILDKQKDENNTTFNEELLTITVHGILHLFGFDHLEKKDYDFVVGMQNKVIETLREKDE